MKKIAFNDRYGLTQAVIEGRKTMMRREVKINTSPSEVSVRIFAGHIQLVNDRGNICAEKKLPYQVGEIVAVGPA